jgi:predicted PurR-regulated permease PerM
VQVLTQFLDDYVLTPTIQGKSTNMDTPTILFASIAGGALAGIYGLLLAIPVAACIKILMREVFWPRFRAWAQGNASDPLPIQSD